MFRYNVVKQGGIRMKFNTLCVQGGYTPGNGEPRQIPIIQSTTFKYDTSEDMGKLFDICCPFPCKYDFRKTPS